MNFSEFDIMQESLWEDVRRMAVTKGLEYSHEADRLANFKRIAEELEIDPLIVCWVYFKKHVDSIASYAKGRRERLSEPIRGRVVDAITYLTLLEGLIEEKDNERV